MLFLPSQNTFSYVTGNAISSQPAAAMGTSFTVGASNVAGAYTSILAGSSITKDCQQIIICLHNNGNTGTARQTLCTIGIDTSGGTTYRDLIPNLMATEANDLANGSGGWWYSFPLFIPAGSQLAIKGSTNYSSTLTLNAMVMLYGGASRPELLKTGNFVESIGVVSASSDGTTLVAGTTSEGAWTSLGTTTKNLWGWQFAGGSTVDHSANIQTFDFAYGDASNKRLIFNDVVLDNGTDGADSGNVMSPIMYSEVKGGSTIYARAQSSSTSTSVSAIAYGIGS
jgi:hypothetical protein